METALSQKYSATEYLSAEKGGLFDESYIRVQPIIGGNQPPERQQATYPQNNILTEGIENSVAQERLSMLYLLFQQLTGEDQMPPMSTEYDTVDGSYPVYPYSKLNLAHMYYLHIYYMGGTIGNSTNPDSYIREAENIGLSGLWFDFILYIKKNIEKIKTEAGQNQKDVEEEIKNFIKETKKEITYLCSLHMGKVLNFNTSESSVMQFLFMSIFLGLIDDISPSFPLIAKLDIIINDGDGEVVNFLDKIEAYLKSSDDLIEELPKLNEEYNKESIRTKGPLARAVLTWIIQIEQYRNMIIPDKNSYEDNFDVSSPEDAEYLKAEVYNNNDRYLQKLATAIVRVKKMIEIYRRYVEKRRSLVQKNKKLSV